MSNKDVTFQEQKFDDDLGIYYYSFKWRNHDPQIGRFIEIDPLSEKYVYNSTYAFSENKVIAHRELEGLEAEYIFKKTWQESGLTQSTGPEIQAKISDAAEKIAPVANTIGKVGKYGLLVAGILTGNPVAIILGLPALGLNIGKDIATSIDPDNQKVKEMPTSVGGALGAMGDKTIEAVTGKKSNGTLQAAGDLADVVGGGVKGLLKKPIVSDNVVENVDKANTIVDMFQKAGDFFQKWFTGSTETPAPTKPAKKYEKIK